MEIDLINCWSDHEFIFYIIFIYFWVQLCKIPFLFFTSGLWNIPKHVVRFWI